MGRVTPWGISTRRVIPGYTDAVKTAVSIPDPLFEAADLLARRRRISRSALYAEAIELLLAHHHDSSRVTAQLDEVYADLDTDPDPFVGRANEAIFEEPW